MERINQATTAARDTIWGNNNSNTATGNHSEVHKSMIDDSVTETKFSGRLESDPDAETSYQPREQNTTDHRIPEGPTSTGGQPQGANVTGENQGTNKNPFSSSNEPNTGFGGAGAQPSVNADPSSAQQDTTKHQGGDRPNAEPDTTSTGSGDSGTTGGGSMGRGAGGPGGMKLPDSENESKGEGTGTLYEKSTGLACDGGDFDATRPGAAREADRLMEEKGIKIGHGEADGVPGDQEKKEKKWYGVDHSGFGGHGSHQNKRLSLSKSSDDTPQEGKNYDNETPRTFNQNDTLDTRETSAGNDINTTEKRGLTQKIKDKLHHSSN